MNASFLQCATRLLLTSLWVFSLALPACAQTASTQFSGMVWERHGDWYINGSSISVRLGEAIAPGSLLTAGVSGGAHSLVVLMPDGQHLLCECFDASTCGRGFRIPAITPSPAPATWNVFVGVRNVLLLMPTPAEMVFPLVTGREAMVSNREFVAARTAEGEVSLAPVLHDLPSGHYMLAVTRDDGQETHSTRQPLDWPTSREVAPLRVDGVGVYRIRVSDQTGASRIAIELLVTPGASLETEATGLTMTRKTIMQWSTYHPGWSLHDFLRVYLQSRAIALVNGS